MVVAVSAAALGIAVVAQIAQGRFPQRSSKQMYLPMGTDGGARRRRSAALTLGPGLVGLGAGAALLYGWLHGLAGQTAWPEGTALGAALGVWWRWLVVLVAVAVIHAAGVRLRMLSQAQMSEREMREERRQTEGSWLKRRRVNEWLRRRL
ncbi:MAG: EscU/YscU/HrcU family type III secretion system export apparatus switch protein [Armatimonadetes bacterium]|nr:EscU/YscU/HrcU family type III secretion system export apparatus switch protein [Armatimonadota bacterium]